MLTTHTVQSLDEVKAVQKEFRKHLEFPAEVLDAARSILDEVRTQGNAAVIRHTKQFDRVDISPSNWRISREQAEKAISRLDDEFLKALVTAKGNIENFHRFQHFEPIHVTDVYGSVIGQRIVPFDRVGVYVPGGRAAYPSTVLMGVIPAKVAGVKEVIVMTPPGEDGSIPDATLAAAYLAGVDAVYTIGGVQAVGAMTYGTETIRRVDKIVGPGNIYVTAAKALVYGTVGLDMVAGPSEVLIYTDGSVSAKLVAIDLFSQAEHDPNASVFLVAPTEQVIAKVLQAIHELLPTMVRKEIIAQSLANKGKAFIVPDQNLAVALINTLAPEHLEILVENANSVFAEITNAGAVFLGPYSPEAIGDYIAGPNHILPTGGSARFFSGLSTYDFLKRINYMELTQRGFQALAAQTTALAELEGLDAHAKSVRMRIS